MKVFKIIKRKVWHEILFISLGVILIFAVGGCGDKSNEKKDMQVNATDTINADANKIDIEKERINIEKFISTIDSIKEKNNIDFILNRDKNPKFDSIEVNLLTQAAYSAEVHYGIHKIGKMLNRAGLQTNAYDVYVIMENKCNDHQDGFKWDCKNNKAAILDYWQRYDEAIELYLEVVDDCKKRSKEDAGNNIDAAAGLADVYVHIRDYEKALFYTDYLLACNKDDSAREVFEKQRQRIMKELNRF